MNRSDTYDVVVVGAGHNGLVAAAYLARAGFSVVVAERNAEPGGAVASGELTAPGYLHDLYATNMNLFLGSPAFAELGSELAAHGLSFAGTSRPFASAFPGGKSLRVHQDRSKTRATIAAHDPSDAEGWDRLAALYDRFAPSLLDLYGTRLPSASMARWLAKTVRAHGARGLLELAQLVLRSTRALGDAYLSTPETKSMLAAWGMHLDFGPDTAMGALFPFLESFTDMDNGMSVVEGGASALPAALAAMVRAAGGEIRTSSPVREIKVENGRAVGAELEDGELLRARRGVIANLTPRPLLRLLPPGALPRAARRRLAAYSFGPGTMVVHAALRGSVPWEAGEGLHEFGYVHLGPYVEDMAQTYTEAMNGLLPASPLLVVGQTSAIDASRAPEGGSVLWIQVRMLPASIRADAGGEIEAREWSEAKRPYAERVLAKLEAYAPGLRERVIDWAVLAPDDLEAADPNLVGGDSVGGSHHLAQNALFRPAPGMSGYRLPVHGLHMVGAGTWPGAGVNAISGRLVALRLIRAGRRPAPLRRWTGRGSA